MVRPTTAKEARQRSRQRRISPDLGPVQSALSELGDIQKNAEFELPAFYEEHAGTQWRLLRVYYEDATGKHVATYCPADEADAISEEELKALSPQELQAEYDVELEDLSVVKLWIEASKRTAEVARSTSGLRRSSRKRNR